MPKATSGRNCGLGALPMTRRCAFRHPDGRPCGAPPLRDCAFCRMHDPAHAAEVEESRKLGRQRQRRYVAIQGSYDLDGLSSTEDRLRVIEMVTLDILTLENTLARARTVGYLMGQADKLAKSSEMEERMAALEAAVQAGQRQRDALADQADDFALGGDD